MILLGRWTVKVTSSGEKFKLKADNLRLLTNEELGQEAHPQPQPQSQPQSQPTASVSAVASERDASNQDAQLLKRMHIVPNHIHIQQAITLTKHTN